jgi:hypothetical protein
MSFFTVPGLHILASKPEGGKSTLIKFELYKGAQQKTYDYAIIFTKNTDDGFEKIIDESYIYYNYKDSALAKILKFQKDKIEEGNSLKLLLIFDDVIGSIDFNFPLMTILITRYRHFNIGVVFSTQYLFKIPPTIRECASKAIMFYQKTKKSLNACYETYGQSFGTYKKFAEYLISNTKDYQFIVSNGKNSINTGKFEIKKIDIKTIPENTRIEF